jgi:hypothetical protein
VGWDAVTSKLRSSTGRGLTKAYAGEILAIVACAWYLLSQDVKPLLVGFLIAGLVGFASIVRMWRGQDEFGPTHRRLARRGTYLYFTASLFFFLALLSFGTFTSPTTGLDLPGVNETQSPTTPHRFRDLLPPVFLLGVAVITEALSGAFLLWHLVGERLRPAVVGYASTAAIVATTVFVRGWSKVQEFRDQGGESVDNSAYVDLAFDEFLRAVLPVFAIGFILTRLIAFWLLRRAAAKVAQAEADQPQEAAPTQ